MRPAPFAVLRERGKVEDEREKNEKKDEGCGKEDAGTRGRADTEN